MPFRKKTTLNNNRNTALWLHVMDIVGKCICAERLGDWHLQLSTFRKCYQFLLHPDKSIPLYLHEMSTLETNYPNLFKQFIDGITF